MSANSTALRVHVATDGDRVTVGFPPGTELHEANAAEFGRELAAATAGRDRPHLVLDLAHVAVLTSVILNRLVALNADLRAAGGHLALRNPAPTLLQVFQVTRLDTVLDIQTAPPA